MIQKRTTSSSDPLVWPVSEPGGQPEALVSSSVARAVLAERSLYEFFRQSWHVTTPGSKLCGDWHLGAIAEHLEAVLTGELDDLLILVPPRCGKTLMASICFPAWAWIRRPTLQFLCASYGQRLSDRHSTDCRRLMQSRWYRDRWGHRWKMTSDVNRVREVQNNHSGHRIATSVDGVSQGEGGDILLVDDPHLVKDVASDTKRAAVHEWWQKSWSTRMNNAAARRITIMQRLHIDDLARRIIDDGAAVLEIPMEYHDQMRPWPLDA